MKIFKTTLKSLPISPNGLLSETILSKCYFCQKHFKLHINSFKNLHKISGFRELFCGFCVRNEFHTKINKDILILSFKNVFDYYYTNNHLYLKKMWVSEIWDIVNKHKKIGLDNPIFHYDEETMNWFINFSRVGETKKKISVEEVYKTIFLIVESLKIKKLSEINQDVFKKKYIDAINLFNTKRYRPKNKKILSPKVGINLEIISFENY